MKQHNILTGQRKYTGYLDKATCIALIREGTAICDVKMSKSEMLKDCCGRFWCPEHQIRGELLNRAAKLNYPAIEFTGKMRYAIGVAGYEDNKMFWETAILMGKEDMIIAALEVIKPLESVTP